MTSKPELMQSLAELRGKALGCLCQSPHSCHGHVLVVTFDPDTDEFIESIVRDNKMYSSDTLDFLKKYEI